MNLLTRFKKALPILALSPTLFLGGCDFKAGVLNPQGPVARLQLDLISWSIYFMLGIMVVVFGLFAFVLWKYRAKPENEGYEPPNIHGNTLLEILWTAIPIVIIVILTIPTVKSIYELEDVPKAYKEVKPITINVTSAEWKWIFSYPEQGIETVNYVNIPKGTPVKFQLTSAGTMGSFWVPELGGQKYTMPGHNMELILAADNVGSFLGRNANFNGEGFAEMTFEVLSQTQSDFNEWVKEVKRTAPQLTKKDYNTILEPGSVGRMTFNGTHLKWVTSEHQHGGTQSTHETSHDHENATKENKQEEAMSTSSHEHHMQHD
ncbi:cytochrome aa3 quinol oxidase subunit II [Priestia filamentosa]|uniref:cytochrome aa3 quinol oxidase subunit II n=1 Tax=Priestia filamentosa TaxID=1402861 RepID=UPI0005892D8A